MTITVTCAVIGVKPTCIYSIRVFQGLILLVAQRLFHYDLLSVNLPTSGFLTQCLYCSHTIELKKKNSTFGLFHFLHLLLTFGVIKISYCQ